MKISSNNNTNKRYNQAESKYRRLASYRIVGSTRPKAQCFKLEKNSVFAFAFPEDFLLKVACEV